MKRVMWFSNHPINEDQRIELKKQFGDTIYIHELSPEGKKFWGSIPPEANMEDIVIIFWEAFESSYTGPIRDLEAVIIMGELSICIAAFNVFKRLKIQVYTPTIRREAQEKVLPGGSTQKVSAFKRVQLQRLYP